MKGRSIRWIETGQVFDSMREVANKFQLKYNTLFSKLNRSTSGSCNVAPGVTLQWEVYIPEEGEEFRPVPGYEGLYSISNKWNVYSEVGQRLLKPATAKRDNAKQVVLYLKGIPTPVSVRKLMSLAWPELVCRAPITTKESRDNASKRLSKHIYCITDDREFRSYMDCCKAYYFDYQEFRKAVRTAEDRRFFYKDKEFLIFS